MDPKREVRVEAEVHDDYWETSYRRSYPEGCSIPGDRDSGEIPEGFGVNEESGDDIRRRERMAEACYEI